MRRMSRFAIKKGERKGQVDMMHNTVVIKSNKAGMTVYLEPEVPFQTLLADIGRKFGDNTKFWGSAQMTLTLEGRKLTAEEEFAVVNQIMENSNLEIVCLVDTDANRIERCEKALNEKLMELSCQTGQFFKGNLQDGETLESEASIIIIGDVERGSKVMAKGNVLVGIGTPAGQAYMDICKRITGETVPLQNVAARGGFFFKLSSLLKRA